MKRLLQIAIFSIALSMQACGDESELHDCLIGFSRENIRQILVEQGPKAYFPKDVEIKGVEVLPDTANYGAVILTSLIWGNMRETKRVVLLDDCGEYLGNYGVNDFPTEFQNGAIFFPYEEGQGNSIDISGVPPPEQVRLDGELIFFNERTAYDEQLAQ